MRTFFNANKQHTLGSAATISGTGLHTGKLAHLTLEPAAPNTGIFFQRTDVEGSKPIKADCDFVVSTSRGTTLEKDGIRIATVEHLLAALVGSGIDNVLVKIDGPEIPIMDGSSAPFMNIIEKAGVVEQDAEKIWVELDDVLQYVNEEKNIDITAVPASDYHVTTLIDFNSPILGTQYATLKNMADFNDQIAPCRTFSFLHELQMLLDNDLIKGGDINNAIVVVDKIVSEAEIKKLAKAFGREHVEVKSEGYLDNVELRFKNEPARHKLLDVVGDLALSGYNVKAHVIAIRPGHESNIAFAREIKKHFKNQKKNQGANAPTYDPNQAPLFNTKQIEKILPHRYPFLLIDKIMSMDESSIIGIKNVTVNEPFFTGHFPSNPIMPGVLQIEALAQTGGVLCISSMPEGTYDTYFLKVDNCKFKAKVVPGDTMVMKMTLTEPIRRGICTMKGSVYVGNKLCTEGEFTAQIVKRPEKSDAAESTPSN